MRNELPKYEIVTYFLVWTTSCFYGFYRVYIDGEQLSLTENKSNDFVDGWVINRKKDVSDSEWELWTKFIFTLFPWIIYHLCISELTRFIFIEALPLCYMITTMLVLISNFPLIVPAYYILHLTLFFFAMMSFSKFVIWMLGVFVLLFINIGVRPFLLNHMSLNEANLIYVSMGWFYIRCLDFVLSEINGKHPLSLKFFNYLGYIFYLPCFFLGPFVPYDHFKFQITSFEYFTTKRAIQILLSVLQCIIYYCLFELASHFLYCNAMHFEIKNYLPMGMSTVSGVGICMANFFYLKYIVIYGISTSIANAENYKMPPRPKCIYIMHLYSKMWRHFDRGFYLFLFRCIYSPVCKSRHASIIRRLFASLLCFSFVCVWHGGTLAVLYWSTFNFIGLICEALARNSWITNSCNAFYKEKHISSVNLRRLKALAASPLWLLAVVSNFFFFGGHEMGLLFIQQIVQGSLLFYITIIIIAYSMCQVSMETESWECIYI